MNIKLKLLAWENGKTQLIVKHPNFQEDFIDLLYSGESDILTFVSSDEKFNKSYQIEDIVPIKIN